MKEAVAQSAMKSRLKTVVLEDCAIAAADSVGPGMLGSLMVAVDSGGVNKLRPAGTV